MISRVRVSARSWPFPLLYPHFNRPSCFWPCVKSCMVGGSNKYNIIPEWSYWDSLWFVVYYLKCLIMTSKWVSSNSSCCIAVIKLYVYIYMRKQNQQNDDERTHFFRKIYLSLSPFIQNGCERVTKGLCVRGELETEQTVTYWPPVSLSLAAFLSHSDGQLNRGSWGSIALCWVLVLSTASYLQPTDSNSFRAVAPGYIIVWRPPVSCEHRICTQFNPSTVKVIPWYLRPDAPVPWSTAGSEVSVTQSHYYIHF